MDFEYYWSLISDLTLGSVAAGLCPTKLDSDQFYVKHRIVRHKISYMLRERQRQTKADMESGGRTKTERQRETPWSILRFDNWKKFFNRLTSGSEHLIHFGLFLFHQYPHTSDLWCHQTCSYDIKSSCPASSCLEVGWAITVEGSKNNSGKPLLHWYS